MQKQQLQTRRQLPARRLDANRFSDERPRVKLNPKVIVAFVILMAILGCYAQLGWQITLLIFGGTPAVWMIVRVSRSCWTIGSWLIAWELDISDELALAQGASKSREKKLQRRLELADHEAKWRLLLKATRYSGKPELRALVVHEESSNEALLHVRCFDMWNEDRKWGNSFKWTVKTNVKAFYKILTLGLEAAECEARREGAGLNEYCLKLFERNHFLVYLIAKMFFPTRHLEVVAESGETLSGRQALDYMRRYLRDA